MHPTSSDATRRAPPQRAWALPPFYFLVAIVAMVAAHTLAPVARWVAPPWSYGGALLVIGGVGLNVWASGLFRRHGTAIRPFEESAVLVVEGPYRFSRHPMYLGMLLLLAGIGVLFGTVTPVVVIPAFGWFLTTKFIIQEEAALERQFGEAFRQYRRRVRRWL